jgi:hypothetical protein
MSEPRYPIHIADKTLATGHWPLEMIRIGEWIDGTGCGVTDRDENSPTKAKPIDCMAIDPLVRI